MEQNTPSQSSPSSKSSYSLGMIAVSLIIHLGVLIFLLFFSISLPKPLDANSRPTEIEIGTANNSIPNESTPESSSIVSENSENSKKGEESIKSISLPTSLTRSPKESNKDNSVKNEPQKSNYESIVQEPHRLPPSPEKENLKLLATDSSPQPAHPEKVKKEESQTQNFAENDENTDSTDENQKEKQEKEDKEDSPVSSADISPQEISDADKNKTDKNKNEAVISSEIEEKELPSGTRSNSDLKQAVGNRQPSYPLIARQKGWEGTVGLTYDVLSDGSVDHIEVTKSSGFDALDEEAVRAIRLFRYLPGQEGKTFHRITFMLKTKSR